VRTIAGLLLPSEGSVHVRGFDPVVIVSAALAYLLDR
jgi:hypothetical protein